ncbi:Protein of unknown function (DUF1699) [Methanomethylovorans hollandica DSM 15978]|jgi:hypothetical protein|uniref:DUF1699 family protein n=1 Tax=Methanomethylovorans hollandica (strain DSM 15978 / NBRC 107637 / DMS1) TaxID=867904 RepID=L0KXP9_METHD|nr:DUF1699 family protein [Methanomethylovorans hollandica]AGB50237.1 Protein of unknown function (DUF1699) [Methanomethylovorans hollandica DSM 15978]
MKIRVVSSKEEINTLSPNEEIVHLAFRPSNTDIFSLIMKCPQVKALHIPSSYKRTISNSAKMYLKMQGIELLEGDVWGHRKDINEYSEVSQNVYDRIKQYRMDGMQEDDIADKMVRETRLSPDFISFLIKSN